MPNTFLQRNGYYPRLYIGGRRISDSMLHGATLNVRRLEGDSATMTITLKPAIGVQDFSLYQGLPIILDIQKSTGTQRVFTGIIDIDEYDIIKELVILRCTDNRNNRINLIPSVVSTIGYWSEDIFGKNGETYQILENRMSTIPYAFDFDAYGNYHLTSWTPKASADFTLDDDDVYRQEPSIERTQRSRVVNKFNINFKYSYQRLHHRETTYNWASNVSACDFLIYGYSLCSKEMVRQAANAVGWPIKTAIGFTALYKSGMYRCLFSNGTYGDVGWQGTSTSSINYAQTQEAVIDGQATTTIKYDQAGNPISPAAEAAEYNTSNLFCIGAQWTATKRFTQNFTEDYTISLSAPQSITQYGEILKTEIYNITDPYDAKVWEDYKAYTAQPSGATNLVNTAGNPVSDYFIDKDTSRSNFNSAVLTAINRAKTSILKSHRENKVMFRTDIWPDVDLKHTVALDCTRIAAKGKVFSVSHTIEIGTGEAYTDVELALYSSRGSASDSVISLPTKPSYVPVKVTANIGLQSHYGEDPTTVEARSWNGHIGNKWIETRTNLFRTNYQEAFIVDSPRIEDNFREDKTIVASQSYTVSIPNNTITLTFLGK